MTRMTLIACSYIFADLCDAELRSPRPETTTCCAQLFLFHCLHLFDQREDLHQDICSKGLLLIHRSRFKDFLVLELNSAEFQKQIDWENNEIH